ncbi:MAG TPA: hypothetical protein VK573_12425 [Gemmatimonadales bacterium]|nr:hypothetical protein [Gemmatimonadales bacterium]
MTFISNYWWAILAIAGAIIFTWRAVRRGSRSVTVGASGVDVPSPHVNRQSQTRRADTQQALRDPPLRLYLVLLAAAALGAGQVARGFPLVHPELGDYAIVGLIGSIVAIAFAMRRVPLFPGPQSPTSDGMLLRAFLGLAFGSLLGGALLVIANGLLDSAPAHEVRTVVASRKCGDGEKTLILRGASGLPNAVTLTHHTAVCREVEPGDSVFLSVKSGFFDRPWIQASRVQTAQERIRLLLDRRRAQSR